MAKEVDFFHLFSRDSIETAREMEKRLGIRVFPLWLNGNFNVDLNRGFIVYNGDGYEHYLTRSIVSNLIRRRQAEGLPPFSYIHIDGHDDMAEMYEGDDNSYKSFTLGILKDNEGGVYFLEEGLTGKGGENVSLLTPLVDEHSTNWGARTITTRDTHVYVSIDFDVLDEGVGIHHLFPQEPIGFDINRLHRVINVLGERYKLLGVDLVGFSRKGASDEYILESLHNIANLTNVLIDILGRD